ncbi:MAG TPA: glycosyltransferase family 4 protein, partial [Geminicoccaceae bacterium]|nr:glycosyltransferase family 4 protein [Geminicoccaceae bacterium]
EDPETFKVEGLSLGEPFAKGAFIRRRAQELAYGRRVAARMEAFAPDVVLSANTPLEVQEILFHTARRVDARFISWIQDFYSVAVSTLLTKKFGLFGRMVGLYYNYIEKKLLGGCDEVIYITEDFIDITRGWNIPPEKCHVIENWAPLSELRLQPRDNGWAHRHGLADKFCILYSGTLGLKHNPELLVRLAESFRGHEQVRVVAVSQGPGRAVLERHRDRLGLENLLVLDIQPYEELPQVLATGDLLVAIIEGDAGVFAVPSKVLTYLCAARPLLLAVPKRNLAARTVVRARAGLVAEANDVEGFVAAAHRLFHSATLRRTLAQNARSYAQRTFDIDTIADKFERILGARPAAAGRVRPAVRPKQSLAS